MASSSKKSAAKGKREPEDDLETKQILKKHKENSNVEEVALRKKKLYVTCLSPQAEISHIISFFKCVGDVVSVRLILNRREQHVGHGFVEFASANEAKKALKMKNGEYLLGRKIYLDVAKILQTRMLTRFCIDHKVLWYEDYIRPESLLIEEEEDETFGRLVEEVTARKKTLFVANLSPQTKISHINNFFNYVGKVISVRLIVNHEGKHVGYGFVEFASADEAKKVLEMKNGEFLHDHKIFLDVAKITLHPRRPMYNLAEKLWYEDCFLQKSLLIEEVETVEGLVEEVAARKKFLFVANLSPQTKISHITNFFNCVGKVVSVRLIVNHEGKHVGSGFVEFASANEAKKVLKMKNGEYLHDYKIYLDVAKETPYPQRPKYCIDHKVWYEDYLRRESLLIEEEDETFERLVEEVVARKKTLFVANLSPETKMVDIENLFKFIGQVVNVRFIVNHEGKHVGCGFVEFLRADKAKRALKTKNGENFHDHEIFLDFAEIAPYPLRPKYNLAEERYESVVKEEDDLKNKTIKISGKKTYFAEDEEACC